jgi:hypothetical protein
MHKVTSYLVWNMRSLNGEAVELSPDTMASIYDQVPFYKVVKDWDDNDPTLSEC